MMKTRSYAGMISLTALFIVLSVVPSVCNQCPEKMDVVFLLDHSGSITDRNPTNGSWDNWVLVKDFVIGMVRELKITFDNTHVGVATFGNMAISRLDLNDLYDSASISNAIFNIPPGNGNTNTYAGLKLMREMFRVENGGRYKIPRVGIIITDGRPTISQELTVAEATALYYAKISLYAIGVTDDIDENFLKEISSPPKRFNHNYWVTPDFRSLVNILRSVQEATCDPDVNFNSECQTMDLVFAISIPSNKNHLTTLENLISNVVSLMPIGIGPKDVRVALTTYDFYSSNTIFRLNSYFDKTTLTSTIRSLNVNSGSSYGDPYRALINIKTEVLAPGQGMRTNSSKVIVLFIWDDQLYNKQGVEKEIKEFVDKKVRVIIIDVRGKLQKNYLQRLVMYPKDVIISSGYTYLGSKISTIANTLCSFNQDVGCAYISEIVLLVDISSSIFQEPNYQILWSTYYKGFLLNFVQAFNIDLSKTRVAIITYNSNTNVIFPLTSSNSLAALESTITNIQPSSDNNVNLAAALRAARSLLSASRKGVQQSVIILNYKYPNIEMATTLQEANILKQQADIISIGVIPRQNKDESIALLKDLSTSPITHYHSALDFTHLNDFLADVIKDVCLISTVPIVQTTTSMRTTTTVTTTISPTTTTKPFICSQTTTRPIPKPSSCSQRIDLLFVIDTTLNVNNNYYTTLYLPMLQSIVGKLEVNNGMTKVAVVAFAEMANVIFNFNTYQTNSKVITALRAVPHRGFFTNLQSAIFMAHNQVFTTNYGARANDPSVSKIMLILTSNPSNNDIGSISEGQKAKEKGIYIVTVGVGTYLNINELSSIATYPYSSNMFVVDTVRKMPNLVNPLTNVICPDNRRLVNVCDPGFAGSLCQECRSGSDILFILPSSYSIELKSFMSMTSFVGQIIESITIDGAAGSRVGIMVAGENPVVSFNMLKHVTRDGLLQAVNIPYVVQKTCNSALALKTAREQIFTPWGGDRLRYPNYVIFISNGFYDDRMKSWLEAVETRKQGINIIMIGIGHYVKKNELVRMATSEKNVHMLASWNDLLQSTTFINTKLSPMFCNSIKACDQNPCRNNAGCSVVAGYAECGPCPIGYSGRYCARACSGVQDVVFLINAASATHRERMVNLVTFASSIVNLINVYPSSTRVALVYWAETAKVLFHLKDYVSRKDVIDAINTTPFVGGKSNTASAFDIVKNEIFTVPNGDRQEAQNIVILITNVNSQMDIDQVIPKAIELRTSGTLMITVGIEFPMSSSDELEAISSFPRPSNQFFVNRFSDLPSIVPSVYDALCDKQNMCTSSPCLNGGRCVDAFNTYHCLCSPTYAGKRCENVCQSRLDIALVLDLSGSVVDEYTISVAMARRLAYGLDITSDNTRMASITFADHVHHGFNLLKYVRSKEKLLKAFDFSLKIGGKTNINDALYYLRNEVFVQSRGDREWAPNVVILLTDGYANVNVDPPFHGSDLLKQAGVKIYVVAIGAEVSLEQLERLASSPSNDYLVHMPPNSNPLDTADALLKKLCAI